MRIGLLAFDHSDKRFQCRTLYCTKGHCFNQTKRIGCLFSFFFLVVCVLEGYTMSQDPTYISAAAVVPLAVHGIILIILFLGLYRLNRFLIWPFLLLLLSQILTSLLVGAALAAVALAPAHVILDSLHKVTPDPSVVHEVEQFLSRIQTGCAVGAVVALFLFISNIWSFIVVNRCCTYIRDFRNYKARCVPHSVL